VRWSYLGIVPGRLNQVVVGLWPLAWVTVQCYRVRTVSVRARLRCGAI